jgi:hypothetical protein
MSSGTYSFTDITGAITGPGGFNFSFSLSGVADEGISIAFTGEKNTMTPGANGDIMHSLHASQAGRITVRFLKTGIGNSQFNAMYRYQQTSSAYWGQNKISVRNPVTGDVFNGYALAFVKHPDNANAKEGNVMEWAFDGVIAQTLGTGSPVATGN